MPNLNVRGKAKKRIVLKVQHRRLNGRAFGCYFVGSAKRGEARIIVDCDALAWAEAAESGRIEFRRQFIDTLAHEFVHAVEDLFRLMFNEKRVNAAIRHARTQARLPVGKVKFPDPHKEKRNPSTGRETP